MNAKREKNIENVEVMRIKNSPMPINKDKDQSLIPQGLKNLSSQGLNNYLLILN